MRRISANYIYPVDSSPLKNGIVEISDDGEILNLIDTKGNFKESRNLEFYNGVITPGFVNTHCHLELSHNKGKVEQQKGFPNFLEKVFELRNQNNQDTIAKSIELYDSVMRSNGIVAVGDVCNTLNSLEVKKKSKIYYHSFVEALGLGNANSIFDANTEIYNKFINENLRASIVPHAPYSVSKQLFLLIADQANKNESIISIHNQETASENDLYKTKSGKLYEKLNYLGVDYSDFDTTGKNSLESVADWLPKQSNLLFVHNTYSKREDVDLVKSRFPNVYWCLCPLSNLYIENKLPDLELFYSEKNRVTLGTDSLSSNTGLSILEEMKTIVANFSKIHFNDLLQWGTLNGANALKIEDKYGSIVVGKAPGLNLITNFDFTKMQISEKSGVKVLA